METAEMQATVECGTSAHLVKFLHLTWFTVCFYFNMCEPWCGGETVRERETKESDGERGREEGCSRSTARGPLR